MKRVILMATVLMLSLQAMPQKPFDFENKWKEVDSMEKKGLPRSALEVVDEIYQAARKEEATPQFVRAILYRVKLHGDFEEEHLLKNIEDVRNEIASSSEPATQVLHSVLAELYWMYYQSNRFMFLDRTRIPGSEPDDIRTWDLAALLDHVIRHYTLSLSNQEILKNTGIKGYEPILVHEKGSATYRPTLYDFLAHRAVDFFMTEESGLTRPADRFELSGSKYFLPAKSFSGIRVTSSDTLSLKYHAVLILQDLLSFHLQDKNPAALIDADLKRLEFVKSNSIDPGADSLYLAALRRISEEFGKSPYSTDVLFAMAKQYVNSGLRYDPYSSPKYRWDLKEAKAICDQAIDKYPGSDGAKNCMTLLPQITEVALNLNTHEAELPGKPFPALLTARNISKVYFRVIPINHEEDREIRQKNRSQDMIRIYRSKTATRTWSIDIPNEGDFQSHSMQMAIPELEPGYYVVLLSPDEAFDSDQAPVAYSSLWVTDIALASSNDATGGVELYLLHRETGEPLKDAVAEAFKRNYDYQSRTYKDEKVGEYTAGKEGYIHIPFTEAGSNSFYLVFKWKGQVFATGDYFHARSSVPSRDPVKRAYFFTDRSIYRPGQTIYYKGILLEDHDGKHQILSKESIKVEFFDVNNQKVSETSLVTNEYGSVQGTFTAPQGVLTGRMRISSQYGSTYIRVEEYKRPRFEVTFEPVKGSYKLNEEVSVTGKAMAYAGNPVDGASVSFRVIRTVRYPFRDYFWLWPVPSTPETEILNGTTTTGADGTFTIDFKALEDKSVEGMATPVFEFRISADVTDINGETHSAEENVSVSQRSLIINLGLGEKVTAENLENIPFRLENLNGEPVTASGSVLIEKLKAPERTLRSRDWKRPDIFLIGRDEFVQMFPNDIYDNEDIPAEWPVESEVYSASFNSENDSVIALQDAGSWTVGKYRVTIVTSDPFGQEITETKHFTLYSENSKTPPLPAYKWFTIIEGHGEPGENASFLIGSSAKDVRVLYELRKDRAVLKRKWIDIDRDQEKIIIPLTEDYRGNISAHLFYFKDNRSYSEDLLVKVPHTDKELDISVRSFRDKIEPGSKEKWSLLVKGYQGDGAVAEILAAMYDASLDALQPHSWTFNIFRSYYGGRFWNPNRGFGMTSSQLVRTSPIQRVSPVIRMYDRLNWFGYHPYASHRYLELDARVSGVPLQKNFETGEVVHIVENDEEVSQGAEEILPQQDDKEGGEPGDIGEVPLRRNLEETAFFFPQLNTNEEGEVEITFTTPESLTRWKFMALGTTTDLRTGYLEKTLVTQKDLMVVPNPPRFLRETDTIYFPVKIVSLSEEELEVQARISFFNARTMEPADDLLQLEQKDKTLTVKAGGSGSVSWRIIIPRNAEAIVYRVRAMAGKFSDGEENVLPVLPNRMLLTETIPLPVQGAGSSEFRFEELLDSRSSSTLDHYRLTLEYTSNPAWYAVQALPYLMEYPYECSEQIFSRYYANSMASHISNANPKIKSVFESWKNLTPDALLSNLEKNEELKSVMLEESPWLMQAKSESERKRRIALLFDLNRMDNEKDLALRKLQQLQLPNGAWPWFKGMRESRYITQYIVIGLARLDHLGIIDLQRDGQVLNMVRRAMRWLDEQVAEDHRRILEDHPDKTDLDHLGHIHVYYLYSRSFINEMAPLDNKSRSAFDYFMDQAEKYWPERNKYLQGMISIVMARSGEGTVAEDIIKSLREHALHSDEMGMYWREAAGWYWYQAPVERQAMMIEAFDEVAGDEEAVEEMKVWLLKQKQTQDWKTTRATAEAIYALLLRGTDLLASDEIVDVQLGYEKVDPLSLEGSGVEAGTGYFKVHWDGREIDPSMGNITVTKHDEGVAWGAVYWQYYEDLDKIKASGSPLSISKELYIEKHSGEGPVMVPVKEGQIVSVGQTVKVRLVIRSDRDLEYVHLKDLRASGLEPVNVLSGYRYQGGLGYYESTRDASSNFFIDYLRKGTYVFEYELNAIQGGSFSSGIATIQCMYAPEFAAHSEGARVEIRE